MIEVRTYPQEETRGPNSPCYWIAECTIEDGRKFRARSKHGASNELARQLVAAGVPDDEMQTYNSRGMKELHYRSFHAAAKWTYTEGNGVLQRVRYTSPEDIRAAFQGRAQSRGISVPEAAEGG